MKAFVLEKNGGVEHLVLSRLPMPAITDNDVLIRTKAFSLNRVDSFVRQHEFAVPVFYKPTAGETSIVLGWDVSGIVVAVGRAVNSLRVGDEVFGLVNFFGRGRTNAEYVAAPADQLAKKPANISHEEAAAAGLTALTAWEAIVTYGQVHARQKVLIHGAGGGVGHFAVQLAKHRGAYVIGTGAPMNKSFIIGLGADEFIDYTSEAGREVVSDVDMVLDPMPGPHILQSLHAAKPGGRVISLLPYEDEDGRMAAMAEEKQLFTHRVIVSTNGIAMKQIAELLGKGAIRSRVSKVFAFEQLAEAHREMDAGKTKGKIVVSVP